MKLLSCFINESMRVLPVVPSGTIRELEQNLEICGFQIPIGTEVQVNTYAVHHNPKYWDNPFDFNPERFENPTPAFMPFALGPRNCIGQTLAIYEMKVIGASIIRNFNVKLAPGHIFATAFSFILKPLNGLKVIFENR